MGSSVVFVLLHSRGCEEGTTVLNDGSAPESLLGGYWAAARNLSPNVARHSASPPNRA